MERGFVLLLAACFVYVHALDGDEYSHVLALNGDWVLSDENQEHVNLPVQVPGGVYTDLMNNGVIPDIFYGLNDQETRWVAKRNWIYSKTFEVNETTLSYQNIKLHFLGLDTFSDITLNGVNVGKSESMFLKYDFDIKNVLKAGSNVLQVKFYSPIEKAKEAYDKQNANYTVPPECVPVDYHGECHVNHIRKMQASFSWDWGPAFPSVGIYKNVSIIAFNSSFIKDVLVTYQEIDDNWAFNITTYFSTNNDARLLGTLAINIYTDIETTQVIKHLDETELTGKEFVYLTTFSIPKSHFKLWWPNGYGDQNLYVVKVTYVSSDETEQYNKRIKVGLRTVELNQDENVSGREFYFKVNNVPIFAKGSNIIPVDILPEKAKNTTTIRKLLTAAKDVHMNMLRIWGGGMYETDDLYTIADELGIMIWQDFMFACSMYPTNSEYLTIVAEEIKQQVRRLQYHPSIVLWAGNNENEAALRGNWYGTSRNFELYKQDYVKLYVDTVKRTLLGTDVSRPYLTSSPTNGIQSDNEGYVSINPYSNYYGDIHYYNYVLDGWNQNIYSVTRFASEYGFQSLPSIKSIMSATNSTSDLNINSAFMKSRQHHPGGNFEMLNLMKMQFNLNETSPNFDKAFIFYSQIYQSVAIKTQTEHYRQWRNNLNSINEGNTMGALYWQLNDVWIAPTWSGIDYLGNWKMQHYYAKEFFAPIIVKGHILPNRDVDVYIISDDLVQKYNVTLDITVYNWNSFTPVHTENIISDINTGSKIVYRFWLDKYMRDINCVSTDCFLLLKLHQDSTLVAPINFILPAPPKSTSIASATVSIKQVNALANNTYEVVIASDKIAAFVWLESTIPGKFSENGFFVVDPEKSVIFQTEEEKSLDEVLKSITVTHLMDSQYL